jgi:hypothetical protein
MSDKEHWTEQAFNSLPLLLVSFSKPLGTGGNV